MQAIGLMVIFFAWTLSKAEAVTFRPFEFTDSALAQRADIAKVSGDLKVTLPTSAFLRTVDMGPVKLTLFQELSDTLNDIAVSSPRQSSFTFEVPHQPTCPALSHFNFELKPSSSCSADQTLALKGFEGLKTICDQVTKPEMSFVGHQVSQVSLSDFYDLNFLIRHAGEPFFHFSLPVGMAPVDFLPRLRVVLTKMQFSELYRAVSDRIVTLQQSVQFLKSHPQCFQNAAQKLAQLEPALGGVYTDLNQLRSYLTGLDQSGRLQAKRDRDTVIKRGRTRDVLPFPSLTDQEREFLSFYLGALYWRARGGGLFDEPQGTQATRIYFTLATMSTISFLNGGERARPTGESLFMRLFEPWSEWQDMGRSPGLDAYHDLVYMTKRGLYQVGAETAELFNRGYDLAYATAGGLMMGPCYYMGWEKLGPLRVGAELSPPYRGFIDDGINWGELCTGGAISLGLAKSLLQGYDKNFTDSHRN